MRVIAGRFKRRTLLSPTWDGVRPTSDALRERLFAVLGDRILDARVLDGCAGSGAIGIEALSRGAAEVVFVEHDPRAVSLIGRNLARCGPDLSAHVIRGRLPHVLDRRRPDPFDIIVLDPPYDAPDIDEILTGAATHLTATGMVVLERARRASPAIPPTLVSTRQIRAGRSMLEWFEPATHDAET